MNEILGRYKNQVGVLFVIEQVGSDVVLSHVEQKKELQGRGHKRKEVIVEFKQAYLRANDAEACLAYLESVSPDVEKVLGGQDAA